MPRFVRNLFRGIPLIAVLVLFSCQTVSPPPSGEQKPGVPSDETAPETPEVPEEELPQDVAGVLLNTYEDAQDTAAALAALEAANITEMSPDDRMAFAVLLRSQGRLEESREQLKMVIESQPEREDAWFSLALTEHAAQEVEARNSALNEALRLKPDMADALTMRGRLSLAEKEWEVAEVDFRKAIVADPLMVDALSGLAWALAMTDREDSALGFLNQAVALAPDYTYPLVDRSRVNVVLRNYNDAEEDLNKCIELEPDVPWHYLDRARIRLRHFRDFEGAQQDLETVERLDPNNFFAQVYLAGMHDELRHFSQSQAYYSRVIEMRPDYEWAALPLGKFAWMQGNYEEAARRFAQASDADSEEFSSVLMTALSLSRDGKRQESAALLQEMLKRLPKSTALYEVTRFCAERTSDFYAVNALNREKNEMLRERLWFYMGAVYEDEGNATGAQAVFERLASLTGTLEYDLAWAALNGMDGNHDS
ncbi:MAG: tetratricopeptide repeat protein [Spirochaetales bacterium]|nr:tetratricopeptide repeat protein [Spirochaetales bacterium]